MIYCSSGDLMRACILHLASAAALACACSSEPGDSGEQTQPPPGADSGGASGTGGATPGDGSSGSAGSSGDSAVGGAAGDSNLSDAPAESSPDASPDSHPAAVCGNSVCEPGESGCTCPSDCPCAGGCDYSRPPGDKPLILYYGYFPDSNDLPLPLNDVLFAGAGHPNLDVAFHIGYLKFAAQAGDVIACRAPAGEFKRFRDSGVRVAKHVLAKADLSCMLDGQSLDPTKTCDKRLGWDECHASPGPGCTADVFAKLIRNGWDYLSIDELSGTWYPSTALGKKLMALVDEMAKRNLKNRLVFWVSYHATEVSRSSGASGTDPLAAFKPLFAACKGVCRKIVFEVYGNELDPDKKPVELATTTVLDYRTGARSFLGWLAARLDAIEPGANDISMAGIGISDGVTCYLNKHACDLATSPPQAPFVGSCPSQGSTNNPYHPNADLHPGWGGIVRQMGWMHGGADTKRWKGFGVYSLGHTDACLSGNTVWKADDLAAVLKDVSLWWDKNP
jgi:hypothetical protein